MKAKHLIWNLYLFWKSKLKRPRPIIQWSSMTCTEHWVLLHVFIELHSSVFVFIYLLFHCFARINVFKTQKETKRWPDTVISNYCLLMQLNSLSLQIASHNDDAITTCQTSHIDFHLFQSLFIHVNADLNNEFINHHIMSSINVLFMIYTLIWTRASWILQSSIGQPKNIYSGMNTFKGGAVSVMRCMCPHVSSLIHCLD